jgi:hypothetical protein
LNIVQNEEVNLNDAILMKKNIKYKECGIIERAYFKGNPEDTFKMNVNGELSLRMSGTLDKNYPLSMFFKDFRKIEGEEEKKNFIFDNSIEIKKLKKSSSLDHQKIKEINYLGMQMKNFVKIRLNSLRRCFFKKIDTRKWKWGNFILIMETDILEMDILDFLYKNKVKIIREEL